MQDLFRRAVVKVHAAEDERVTAVELDVLQFPGIALNDPGLGHVAGEGELVGRQGHLVRIDVYTRVGKLALRKGLQRLSQGLGPAATGEIQHWYGLAAVQGLEHGSEGRHGRTGRLPVQQDIGLQQKTVEPGAIE